MKIIFWPCVKCVSSVQSLSHVHLFATNLLDCSIWDFPLHHQLPELAETHVWVGDAIQSSHPLLSLSSHALNLSQHQGLLKWVSSSLRLLEKSLAWYIVFIPKVCPFCVLMVGSRYLLRLLVEIQALISVSPLSSCPQSFPASGSFSMSQQMAKVLELQHQSFQWIFRVDFL